jgi:hypothetical protein
MAVAKRKIEREKNVLNQSIIQNGAALVEFAVERGIDSVHQLRMYCVIAQRQLRGEKTTLASYVKLTRIAFSTASRLGWDLYGKELLRYEDHPDDRRKKFLVAIIP